MKKSLTRQLKEAKEKIKDIQSKLDETTKDRDQFREYMISDLHAEIKHQRDKTYTDSSVKIQAIIKRMQNLKKWYW